jgi:gamma-glutamylcyclotransferase (GGCT)/AIG2-like uncharacterized protein YtfP
VPTLLFVYGTLKRGCSNHAHLAGQTFVAAARTPSGYRLYDLGGYPGLYPHAGDTAGVTGELWSVDDAALARLDRFEGVHEGLYRRTPLRLLAPHDTLPVHAYFPGLPPDGRPEVGAVWQE